MRRLGMLLALLFGLAAIPLGAGTLNGVTLPDTVQVGAQTLILNGMGLRTKYMVKVYIAGLYLAQKSSDPDAILKADGPRRMVMHFVRDISKGQLIDGFTDSFHDNMPEAEKAMKAEIDRFFAALDSVKDGDEVVISYIPSTGTTVSVAGKEKVSIAGPDFGRVIFSVWLGPKPPNAGLKKGILGQ